MTDPLKTTVAAATTATVQLAAMLALSSDDPARREAARRYLAESLAETLDAADECQIALRSELATAEAMPPALVDAEAHAMGLRAMIVSVVAAIDLAIELAGPELEAHAEQRVAAQSGGARGLSTDEAAWVEPPRVQAVDPKDPR